MDHSSAGETLTGCGLRTSGSRSFPLRMDRQLTSSINPLEAALSWIDRGFLPVPVGFRSEKPCNPDDPQGKNWQNLRITAETAPQIFQQASETGGNVRTVATDAPLPHGRHRF